MEFELLNELVENGYEAEELDELFEFCVNFATEYEEIIEEATASELVKAGVDAHTLPKHHAQDLSKKAAALQNIKNAAMKHKKKLGAAGAGLALTGGGAAMYKKRKRAAANESEELLAKILANSVKEEVVEEEVEENESSGLLAKLLANGIKEEVVEEKEELVEESNASKLLAKLLTDK